VAAGLGPVAAHAHVAPAAAGVLAEVEEQPAAVPLARAVPKLGVTNRTSLARLDLAGRDDLP
jgi:hypothetical protein